MDRERQEPTFTTPDLTDMKFRNERTRQAVRSEAPSPWTYIAVSAALLIVIAMGLIEWNARRQAAAITRELTRPMTKEEQASFDAEMARSEKEDQEIIREHRRYIDNPITLNPQRLPLEPAPLRDGERCIQGRRFQRIDGGWRDRPLEPC